MKRTVIIYAVILLIILMGGCAKPEVTADIFAMDTVMSFTLYGTQQDIEEIKTEIYRLDQKFSSENQTSVIYQMNHEERTALDEETLYLLRAAQEMKEQTNGSFDVSLGAISRRWGFFNRSYEKDGYTVPEAEEINSLLKDHDNFVIDGNVFVRGNAEIDFGACVKGYAGDRIAGIMKEKNISGAVFSLGGNICTVGEKRGAVPWSVAIRSPQGGYLGTLEVGEASIVTSGAYQRYFEKDGIRYHHILDPATGKPADSNLTSVTAVSDSGLMADMLSTAVFVMGLEGAEAFYQKHNGFELILKSGTDDIYITEGLEKQFIPEKGQDVHIIKRG